MRRLGVELGGPGGPLEYQVADATDAASVRALVEQGNVLATTVGPFARWGAAAVEAAVATGAHYVDSAGEGCFPPRRRRGAWPASRGRRQRAADGLRL